jgi:hypothetical protein
MSEPIPQLQEAAADAVAGYAPEHEHRPLGGYAVLSAAWASAFAGSLLAAHARGHALPERVGAGDVALIGVATHKLSRLMAKDKVTSFLRAPFTEFQDTTGYGELEEKARGRGLQKATGELVICPYCLAQWVSSGFAVGLVAAPRLTRLLAAMWTAQAIGDFAQLAYSAAEKKS